MLAADGLHLNFEGTPIAVSNIESAILEVRRDLLKAEFDMLQQLETSMLDENVDVVIQGEQSISTSEEKLPYSEFLRYGEERSQAVLASKTETNVRQTANSIPGLKISPRQKPQKGQRTNRHHVINTLVKKQPAVPLVNVPKCKKTIPMNPQKKNREI